MGWVPLWVRVDGLRVSVLGGGSVGERRARLFAGAGGRVRVYGLEFTRGLLELASRGVVELVRVDLRDERVLREAVLWGDIVVVAVSDPSVAERASRLGLEAGRLVNDSVVASRGRVVVPYRGSTGYGLEFAVTSLGRAGPPARRSRDYCLQLLNSSVYFRTLMMVFSRLKSCLRRLVSDPGLRVEAMLAADASGGVHVAASLGDFEAAAGAAVEAAERVLGGVEGLPECVLEGGGEPGGDQVE